MLSPTVGNTHYPVPHVTHPLCAPPTLCACQHLLCRMAVCRDRARAGPAPLFLPQQDPVCTHHCSPASFCFPTGSPPPAMAEAISFAGRSAPQLRLAPPLFCRPMLEPELTSATSVSSIEPHQQYRPSYRCSHHRRPHVAVAPKQLPVCTPPFFHAKFHDVVFLQPHQGSSITTTINASERRATASSGHDELSTLLAEL
jgi:hypothetical protein